MRGGLPLLIAARVSHAQQRMPWCRWMLDDHLVEVRGPEPQELPDLEVPDSPLVDEAAHELLADVAEVMLGAVDIKPLGLGH